MTFLTKTFGVALAASLVFGPATGQDLLPLTVGVQEGGTVQ